jgi:hypothetical protein
MTSFEKICALLLALEHDLRTPVGVLKGDLDGLKAEGGSVDRMARQVDRILGIIPPVERIMTEVLKGGIVADITRGGTGNSWFLEQIRSLGMALDGRTTRLSFYGIELRIVFEPASSSGAYYQIAGREFTAFWKLFEAMKSNSPSYVLMLDAIVEHLGWNLSLRIQ